MSQPASDTSTRRNRQAIQRMGNRTDFAILGNKEGGTYAILPAMRNNGVFTNLDIWAATTAYLVNDCVRPTIPNGFGYRCTVAGNSAATEPTWPTVAGQTVVDGGVTWICHNMRPSAVFILE